MRNSNITEIYRKCFLAQNEAEAEIILCTGLHLDKPIRIVLGVQVLKEKIAVTQSAVESIL